MTRRTHLEPTLDPLQVPQTYLRLTSHGWKRVHPLTLQGPVVAEHSHHPVVKNMVNLHRTLVFFRAKDKTEDKAQGRMKGILNIQEFMSRANCTEDIFYL
mgnify:CR=1 FL=1